MVARALEQDKERKSSYLKDGFDNFSAMERGDEFVKDIKSLRLSEFIRIRRRDVSMPNINLDSLCGGSSPPGVPTKSNYFEYYLAAAMTESAMLRAMAVEVARSVVPGAVAGDEVSLRLTVAKQPVGKEAHIPNAKRISRGLKDREATRGSGTGRVAAGQGCGAKSSSRRLPPRTEV